MHRILIAGLFVSVLFAGCSGTEEMVEETPKPVEKVEEPTPDPIPEKDYKYTERYYVQKAEIDNDVDVDDPLEAIRVIQLLEGRREVLVISSFDEMQEGGKTVNMESWLGIELPAFTVGTHTIQDATNVKFYRFYLGDKGKRLDGETYAGSITIDSIDDEYIRGKLSLTIRGTTKSFHEEEQEFKLSFSGDFRIEREPLEVIKLK